MGFDVAAFEAFGKQHPDVVEPPILKVRRFVAEFVRNADVQTMRLKDLFDAMEARLGPVRTPLKARVKRMATDHINGVGQEEEAKKGVKRKSDGMQPQASAKPYYKPPEIMEDKRSRIDDGVDIAWAASLLAPMGFKGRRRSSCTSSRRCGRPGSPGASGPQGNGRSSGSVSEDKHWQDCKWLPQPLE